jgi:predicted nucleotidyltransferase
MRITAAEIEKAILLAKAYGATRLILFGSVLHSPDTAEDLDLACDGVQGWKLYELAGRLEDELHVPLDLVPLSPPNRFTEFIESEGKVLYEARKTS